MCDTILIARHRVIWVLSSDLRVSEPVISDPPVMMSDRPRPARATPDGLTRRTGGTSDGGKRINPAVVIGLTLWKRVNPKRPRPPIRFGDPPHRTFVGTDSSPSHLCSIHRRRGVPCFVPGTKPVRPAKARIRSPESPTSHRQKRSQH